MGFDVPVYDLSLIRGDSRAIDFAVTQSGAPVDLTGWTLWFTIKRRYEDLDAAAVVQKSTASTGITLTDAAQGEGQVKLVPADTAGLSTVDYALFWDLQGKDGNGDVWTLARGRVLMQPDVTQSTS